MQRALFVEGREKFFSHCKTIGVLEFVGYVIVSVVMYALLWYQSSKGLGNRIKKAKRMLNMMPMELVMSNELLKEKVLSHEIQRVLA